MLSLGLGKKKSYISSPSKSALCFLTTDRLNCIDYFSDILTRYPPKDSSRTDG